MGLFNDPYSHLGPKESDRLTPMPKAACTAKKRVKWRAKPGVAEKPSRNVTAEKIRNLAVVGPLADSKRDVMGSWSAQGLPINP